MARGGLTALGTRGRGPRSGRAWSAQSHLETRRDVVNQPHSSVKRRGFTDNLKKNDDLKEHVLQIIIGNKQNQNVSTLD